MKSTCFSALGQTIFSSEPSFGVQLSLRQTQALIKTKRLSINYVDKNVGMKSTRFSALGQTLFSSEPS